MKTPKKTLAAPRPSRPLAIRILVLLLKGGGALLLLCLLVLGGALLWLRTSQAENFLLEQSRSLLAGQGFRLEASRLSGPLPQRLALEGLAFADADGPIFTASRLELRWSLSSLLTGELLVEAVLLKDPELFRLPVLPPAEDTPPPPEAPSSFSLPLSIRLGELSIQGGRLHGAVLRPEAGDSLPVFDFALAASAALSNEALAGTVQGSLRHPDRSGFSLHLQLEASPEALGLAASGKEDRLDLSLQAFEEGNGLLAALLDRTDLPAYRLHLKGAGSLRDWRAQISLLAGKASGPLIPPARDEETAVRELRPDLLDLAATIGLQGASGSLWKDMVTAPDFNLSLQTEAIPGPDMPASLLPALGKSLKARADVKAAGERFSLRADARSSAWQFTLSRADIGPDETAPERRDKARPMVLRAALEALVNDPAFLAGKAQTPKDGASPEARDSGREDFPLQAASFTADLDAVLDAGDVNVKAKGLLSAQSPDREFTSNYELAAETRGTHIALRTFAARGLGVTLEAKADIHADSGAITASVHALAPDKAEWQSLLGQLSGYAAGNDGSSPFGGEIRLDANLDLPGFLRPASGQQAAPAEKGNASASAGKAAAPATGSAASGLLSGKGLLRLSGKDLRWPEPRLTALIGPSVTLAARLEAAERADGTDNWTLLLDEASAGIFKASGQAVFTSPAVAVSVPAAATTGSPAATAGSSAASAGSPAATAGVPVVTAGSPAATGRSPSATGEVPFKGTPRDALPVSGALQARLQASIADLTPLDAGLSGSLKASAEASGPLEALDFRLAVDSPALKLPSGVLRALSLRLEGALAQTAASAPQTGKTAAQPQADRPGQAPDSVSPAMDTALSGTMALKAADSPGGPLSLSGRWQAKLPADGSPVAASLRDFLVQGAGVKLNASLDALIAGQSPGATAAKTSARADSEAPATPPVSLQGSLTADIRDWKQLAALSGAPLSGGPASLRLRLDNAGGGQSAKLDFTLQSLIMKEAGSATESLALRNLSASFVLPRFNPAAADPLSALAPDFRLRMDQGLAGPLRWSKGAVDLKGSGGKGEFSLSLDRERPTSRRNTGSARGRNTKRARIPRELLALQGRYDAKQSRIQINTLSMQSPLPGTAQGKGPVLAGFRLQKALTLDLAEGARFSGLELAFQPAGRLSAEAVIVPEKLKLKADLQSLPFSVFKLFTDAALPDGELRLTADLDSSAQGPRGSISLNSRIKAPAASQFNATAVAASNGKAASKAARPGMDQKETAPASAFDLGLRATLSPSPGPAAAPGSGARARSGFVWLSGSGRFGNAAAPDESKEGRLAFQIPLRLSPEGTPAPDSAAPMAASLHWNGPVERIWDILPLPDQQLSGPALIDMRLTGSLDKPRPSLAAYLNKCRFEDIVNGILLTGITMETRLSPEGNARMLLAAGDGGKGKLALEADIRGLLHEKTPHLALRGQIDALSPLHRDDLNILLSGIFGVKGPADAPAVTADITVLGGEVTLSSKLGGASISTLDISPGSLNEPETKPGQNPGAKSVAEAPAAAEAAPATPTGTQPATAGTQHATGGTPTATTKVATADRQAAGQGGKKASPEREKRRRRRQASGPSLDLRIAIPRHFFIRGMGLDSEWEGALRIDGPASDPSLRGSLKPVRGSIDILSKSFDLTGGDISFTGGMSVNPLLNLELSYEGPTITALIRAAGSAKKPKLILESRPPLPQDEVLAQVLFGKDSSDLSRFEAIQLANSMRELSGVGGSSLDIISGIRKSTGLDVLRLGSGQQEKERSTSGQSGDANLTGNRDSESRENAGAPSLEAGKYITDSIYIGVEQGLTQESTAVRIDVELYPSLHLEGRSSASTTEIGIGWKKDY